jgi:hypothetical protein
MPPATRIRVKFGLVVPLVPADPDVKKEAFNEIV